MSKKRNRKKEKTALQKKDKILFGIGPSFLFLIIIIILFNYENVDFFCAKFFSGSQYYFSELKINFFSVMIFVLLTVEAMSLLIYIENALGLKIPFKEYYSGNNVKANKQIKSFVIYSVIILILFCSSFCIAGQARISADDKEIKSFNIIKDDETIFIYDNITKVDVYVEYDSGIWTGNNHINRGYKAVVEVRDKHNSYVLHASGFNNNYLNIEKFINKFNSDIVTINNTDSDKIVKYSKEQQNAINRIFDIQK